jgi:2-polyprenyl-3-methyl-5-hydroxy-6-metoxy-1,4-benzoquinol methylase
MRPHKLNQFTGYMRRAVDHLALLPAGAHILDLPAGNGQVTDALRAVGHRVTSADINGRRADYVHADMHKPLPFDTDAFDGVICLEGIEHVLNPVQLLGELIRVTKIGGHVVISTPNIMNMYSRLQFLFTGTFYQFHPAQLADIAPEELKDRYHISPVSYHTLRYQAEYFGARVIQVRSDKSKRTVLMPVYLLILLLGKLWSYPLFFARRYQSNRERNLSIYRHVNSWSLLFGRTLIVVLEKKRSVLAALADSSVETAGPVLRKAG